MRRRVFADAYAYDFVPDDAPLLARRHWAIAVAQLVDDIAGTPLTVPPRVRVVLPGTQDELGQDGARARRVERGITVKTGADGTFALVCRPWARFTPFAAPIAPTVEIEADGFVTLRYTFAPIAYTQRLVAAPAPAASARVVTLDSNAGLVAGQTLLFGPAADPQYVRIATVDAGNQVTLEAGVRQPHVVGEAVFPDTFATPTPVILPLRRVPVQIVGRVVVRDTTANVTTPVPNASITVTDLWRTRAAVNANPASGAMTDPNPARQQFTICITPGALTQRAAAANVGAIALPPVVGDDRLLAESALNGTVTIDATMARNLGAPPAPLANRLILIEPDDATVAEYQTIATVQPVGAPEEPAVLGLELPLRRGHREDTRVTRINAPGALPPTPRLLRDDAAPGDRCVFLDGLGGLGLAGTLRLTGVGPFDEFQSYAQLAATSDAAGHYRLPPIQRIARLQLRVDDGVHPAQSIQIDPEYGDPEQRLDVVYFV